MMNVYLRVIEFEIDGKVVKTESWPILVDEKDAKLEAVVEGHGNTFDSLWNFMNEKDYLIPANRWTRAFWSKKRRIEFFVKAKTWIDNGTERLWSLCYVDVPHTISMERLLKFDADKVAQYFSERNLKIGD